jgi:fibronectin type 3 domain-containing protein
MAVCDTDKLPAPVVAAQKTVTAKLCGANDFKISWSTQKITGHTVKYKVQYQKKGGSWVTYKKAATVSSCIKYDLLNGTQYRFRVTPFVTSNGKTYSGTAKTTSYCYTLKAPKQPTVKRISATKATLKWNKVNGATSYKIYRSAKKNGNYTCVKTVDSKYLSSNITAKKGKGYYYKVRACKGTVMGQLSIAKYYKFK